MWRWCDELECFLFSVEIWRLKLSVRLLRQILSYFVCIYTRNWQTINMMMMMMICNMTYLGHHVTLT